MIYGYASVSAKGQFDAISLEEQTRLIKQRYPSAEMIVETYEDPKERPVLRECVDSMYGGDTLVVSRLDRLCSTIKEGISFIEYGLSRNVRINIINVGMVDSTHTGRMILNIMTAFAEFDKAMIVERTQVGKAIAKTKEGFKEGRPKKFTDAEIEEALNLLKTNSYKVVEERTGISKSTLIRARRA
ncbi:recombinase family protein [Aminipila butyrica]|uniref:Recombinase family protein n=1 Tax=Aminipila butyrica TaxID=433296 RepID=A0A858BZ90_9FIRM|nr:recombinase family protein [Aminipila butyrica]QIB69396.1 recombinase family protein [Aminipila butyrica]